MSWNSTMWWAAHEFNLCPIYYALKPNLSSNHKKMYKNENNINR